MGLGRGFMTVLRFPRRRRTARGSAALQPDRERPPANLRFLLTPDNDPALDFLDTLPGLELLDDVEREARIAVARQTAS